jgi:hypothetical protein
MCDVNYHFERFVDAHGSIEDVDFNHLPDWLYDQLAEVASSDLPLCECCLLNVALHRHGDGDLLTGFATAWVNNEEAAIIGTNDLSALKSLSADFECGVRLLGYYVTDVGYVFALTANAAYNVFDTRMLAGAV